MWSVWKHCIKYLCILWFWWHKRDVLLQFKPSDDSGRRNWCTCVKCFKWFWLPFQQQTGCFRYTSEKRPHVQILDDWKMYRNQVTNSSGSVLMEGLFLKEILLPKCFIASLKSDWIFYSSGSIVHYYNWLAQHRTEYWITGRFNSTACQLKICIYRKVFLPFVLN